jgi:UDP-glucose 4-epimerase
MAGEDVTIEGDGSQTRDFVHVSDIVRANLAVATTNTVGEAVNVCTGTETSVLELAGMIVDQVDFDADIVHLQPRAGDVDRRYSDGAKASEILGIETSIALEEGIRDLTAE